MSSSEINNSSLSTCNYASLGNYDDLPDMPNTLGNILNNFVTYPVVPNYQVVPYFAGTGDYTTPNYNSLTKGSCYNYAGINRAYIDCSNPASSQGCDVNGGQCVTYAARSCSSGPGPSPGPTMVPTMGPTMMPTMRPTMMPTMGPTMRPTMGPTMGPTMMPTMGPTMGPTMRPTMLPTMGPTMRPTMLPTMRPTMMPTMGPTMRPTMMPTMGPTSGPTF